MKANITSPSLVHEISRHIISQTRKRTKTWKHLPCPPHPLHRHLRQQRRRLYQHRGLPLLGILGNTEGLWRRMESDEAPGTEGLEQKYQGWRTDGKEPRQTPSDISFPSCFRRPSLLRRRESKESPGMKGTDLENQTWRTDGQRQATYKDLMTFPFPCPVLVFPLYKYVALCVSGRMTKILIQRKYKN